MQHPAIIGYDLRETADVCSRDHEHWQCRLLDDNDAELSALCELVNRFGGGCQMKTLPIVDLDEEREFIAAVFEREAAQALQEITRDVRSAMGSSITGAAYAKLKERYDEILEKAQEHMVNLQVTQDITAASAEVALDALAKLQEKMAA